jgi:hypothetical protein
MMMLPMILRRKRRTLDERPNQNESVLDTTDDPKFTGSCKACLGAHSLKNCFYVFETLAPEGWKPNLSPQRLVKDRINAVNSLAEEIKRFRKGKDSADNS